MTGISEQDARALTYLAARIRTETYGAGPWDDHGTFVNIMKRAGQNIALVAQDVIGHAARPDAKTPGVIASSMRGPTVEAQRLTLRPPKREEACVTCGRFVSLCGGRCKDDTDDEPVSPALPKPARILSRLERGIGPNKPAANDEEGLA